MSWRAVLCETAPTKIVADEEHAEFWCDTLMKIHKKLGFKNLSSSTPGVSAAKVGLRPNSLPLQSSSPQKKPDEIPLQKVFNGPAVGTPLDASEIPPFSASIPNSLSATMDSNIPSRATLCFSRPRRTIPRMPERGIGPDTQYFHIGTPARGVHAPGLPNPEEPVWSQHDESVDPSVASSTAYAWDQPQYGRAPLLQKDGLEAETINRDAGNGIPSQPAPTTVSAQVPKRVWIERGRKKTSALHVAFFFAYTHLDIFSGILSGNYSDIRSRGNLCGILCNILCDILLGLILAASLA